MTLGNAELFSDLAADLMIAHAEIDQLKRTISILEAKLKQFEAQNESTRNNE